MRLSARRMGTTHRGLAPSGTKPSTQVKAHETKGYGGGDLGANLKNDAISGTLIELHKHVQVLRGAMIKPNLFVLIASLFLFLTGQSHAACLGTDTGDFGSSDTCSMHPYYEQPSGDAGSAAPAGGGSPDPDPDPEPDPEPDEDPPSDYDDLPT